MKKFAALLIISIGVLPCLHADIKFMGGMNLSKYNSSNRDPHIQLDFKLGFQGGIGFERSLTDYISLEFNVLYFLKGSNAKLTDLSGAESRYNLKIVSFPLLAKGKFMSASSPYVLGGMEISSLLSHGAKFKGIDEEVDFTENTKTLDFGFVLGCGYELEIQEHLFFFIETRYHHGMNNIMNNLGANRSWKTKTFLVLIGVKS
jgi:opacity protein-like surface antigen